MKIAHRAARLKIAHRAATPDFDGGAISETMVAVFHFQKQVAVFCFLACSAPHAFFHICAAPHALFLICAAPHAVFLVVQQLPTRFLCRHL
jgi:hypothetical protein